MTVRKSASPNIATVTDNSGKYLTTDGISTSWSGIGKNYTAVNAGGTALTGATSITVSGISAKDDIQIIVNQASSANISAFFSITFNSDSTAKYNYAGLYGINNSVSTNWIWGLGESSIGTSSLPFGRLGDQAGAAGYVTGGIRISGANASGVKIVSVTEGASVGSGINGRIYGYQGWYAGTSAISSVTITSSTGNFDNGTIYVFASA